MEEVKKKSISNLLDKNFGKLSLFDGGERGKILHEAMFEFLFDIFKTANRSKKINYRIFSQRITKVYNDILSGIKKYDAKNLYYEDVKFFLRAKQKEITQTAKIQAKENNYVVVPDQVEKECFGGITELESEAVGKIGGIGISARVDLKIETSMSTFKIRDYKSCELNKDDEPQNPQSALHRHFMQICLYGVIFEKELGQSCEAIELEYFPNKIISYAFTKELKQIAIDFAKKNAFDGFEGISFDFSEKDERQEKEEIDTNINISGPSGIPPIISQMDFIQDPDDNNSLGWVNTVKGKPLELIRGKDNKFEGYLYPNKANKVKDGDYVVVEKTEGGRILCIVEKIECSEDNYPGETSSHHEQVYKIKLNPEGEFTVKGYEELRPQTIIGGKIKLPTEREFMQYRKLPQNGIPIAAINQFSENVPYRIDKDMLFQSTFIGGVQGTGKTNAIKNISVNLGQDDNAPAQIILDNEEEYGDLKDLPSNAESMKLANLKKINSEKFREIKIERGDKYCLTLKAIDPPDLRYLLRELTSTSAESLLIVIDDIISDHPSEEFPLPELKRLIFKYMEKKEYNLFPSTRSAIWRALQSPYLKLFDIPGAIPIKIDDMLSPGNITVVNTRNLNDDFQRIVALYFFAMLHKKAMKGKDKLKLLLIMDEVHRILPKSKSKAEENYLKRITSFIGEILHRGRKRDYGIIFATQSPLDVKKEFIDLSNTKIFFQIQGKGLQQLDDYLNAEDRERLKRLPIGHAFITSKGKHEPVEIKFPFLN